MYKIRLALYLLVIATLIPLGLCQQNLPVIPTLGSWRELEFEFPTEAIRRSAISSGDYVPGNAVPIDVDIDYRGPRESRVFVTVPRFTTGIPMTLATLTGRNGPLGPIITPYPNYSWHTTRGRRCTENIITSVFRVAIDECKRLWVVDTGRIGDDQICPPQILVFDLRNDSLIHRYRFPDSQVKPKTSLFITPVVDVRDPMPMGQCYDTKVYIADVNGFSIMVYDQRTDRSWRIVNKLLYPNPHFGTFRISNEEFDLMDGVFGMALSPKARPYGISYSNANRNLYFHALAAITENQVPLTLLDNSTIWNANPESMPRSFIEIGNRGAQSSSQAMDSNGNLFFALANPNAIGCWDSTSGRPYGRSNIKIVALDDTTLQFASGLKVIRDSNGKEDLWVLTCRFQKIMTGSITNRETNFRILAISIRDLLGGQTKCSSAGIPMSNLKTPF